MYGVAPDQLPPGLRQTLLEVLQVSPTVLAASMRSGCVRLGISVLVSEAEAARVYARNDSASTLPPTRALLGALVSSDGSGARGPSLAAHKVACQLGQQVALFDSRRGVLAALCFPGPGAWAPRLLPRVELRSPPCVTAGSPQAGRVVLRARGLADALARGASLHCRVGGLPAPLIVEGVWEWQLGVDSDEERGEEVDEAAFWAAAAAAGGPPPPTAEQQPLQQQEANEALGEEAEELLEQEVVVCVAGMACAHGLYEFELQIGV